MLKVAPVLREYHNGKTLVASPVGLCCNMNYIEDKYNFLVVCPVNRDLRQIFF